jgi:GT2 family glycosyltransferase/MoaA/NifB/PqqE/SkfB family radical SAM enzyme
MEIVAVNNRSEDGSLEILIDRGEVRLIDPGKNLGFSAANNVGIAASKGKYVICLNFDCLLTPEFLQHVWDAFEADPRVGMISGKLRKLVDMNGTMYLDSTGIDFTTLIPADRGEWEYDEGQYDSAKAIFGPSGAAGCYRRSALDEVAYKGRQYFDEQMFTYCEDIDLAWRLNLAGWRGLYVPRALAFHERGATRRDSFWMKVGYICGGFSNRWLTILKNLRWKEEARPNFGKILLQEWRFLSSWCGRKVTRWGLGGLTLMRLARLVLRPSFFGKRRLSQGGSNGANVPLELEADFWKDAYERRRVLPLEGIAGTSERPPVLVGRDSWLVTPLGFAENRSDGDNLFEGVSRSASPCLELHVPELYRKRIGKMTLLLEMDCSADVTGHLSVIAETGQCVSTDWFLFAGGKGTYVLDLERTRLAPGPESIRTWTAPWDIIRLHISQGVGSRIVIRSLAFTGGVDAISNQEANAVECRNLPLVMQSKPVLVYAEVSTLCNIRCSICGRAVYGVKPEEQGLMKREVFDRLAEVFTPGGNLALFGRGETLLHPDFTHFLRLAKARGMRVCFNSNGKCLTREIAEAMVTYGQDSLTLSCSAGSAETYGKVHCGATWAGLWDNIATLLEVKRGLNGRPHSKPSIYLEFVSQKRNIRELPSLVERAIEWDLQGVLVIDLVAHSDELEKQRMNTPDNAGEAETYYQIASDLVEKHRRKKPHFELRLPSRYDGLTKKSAPEEVAAENALLFESIARNGTAEVRSNFCLEPWQTFYVRFDGTVAPCVITKRSLGDLNSHSASEVWNGPQFSKFRERMCSADKPYECPRCHLFPGPQRYDKALDRVEEYAPL